MSADDGAAAGSAAGGIAAVAGGAHKFSRQIATYGRSEQERISRASVLISGMSGLGAETAKNLVLSGVAECVIHDDSPIGSLTAAATWSNFYIPEAQAVGAAEPLLQPHTTRAQASLAALRRQNPMVDIKVLEGPLVPPGTDQLPRAFDLVVLLGHSRESIARVDAACRAAANHPTPLIAADVVGLVSWVFNDFGPAFVTQNADGQPPLEFLVDGVSRDTPALLRTTKANPDDTSAEPDRLRHRLQDGARIKFRGNDNTLQQVCVRAWFAWVCAGACACVCVCVCECCRSTTTTTTTSAVGEQLWVVVVVVFVVVVDAVAVSMRLPRRWRSLVQQLLRGVLTNHHLRFACCRTTSTMTTTPQPPPPPPPPPTTTTTINQSINQRSYTVKVVDAYSFTIDANGAEAVFEPFRASANVQEVKVAETIEFRPFNEARAAPTAVTVMADMVKSFSP
jgi:molybdopterin/thiamine biosynthesis adenylyltransferase